MNEEKCRKVNVDLGSSVTRANALDNLLRIQQFGSSCDLEVRERFALRWTEQLLQFLKVQLIPSCVLYTTYA